MEQKNYFIYQIVALAISFLLVILLCIKQISTANSWIIGLLIITIVCVILGLVIVYFLLKSKLKELQNELPTQNVQMNNQPNDQVNNQPNENELKEIRSHHLAERYIEEVYPALLRNNANDKEAIESLNLQICKILGHNSNIRCNVSMAIDIITVVITDDNDKKLKLVYNKKNKELNVDSTDGTYTLNNNIGITVKSNIIEGIDIA